MSSDGANADKGSSNDDSGLSNGLSSMTIDSSSNSCKKKKKYTCLYCLKEVEGSKRCSRCETGRYCGKECQEKHWPVHKNSCQDSNTEDSIEKLEIKAKNNLKQGNSMYISNGYHHY